MAALRTVSVILALLCFLGQVGLAAAASPDPISEFPKVRYLPGLMNAESRAAIAENLSDATVSSDAGPEVPNAVSGLQGLASLQAPVVVQIVEIFWDGSTVSQEVTESGRMINVSIEVLPGKGRVLVETQPLMGIIFQDAANTALSVAENRSGSKLSGSDVIVSIEAGDDVTTIDGPSAGALMTVLLLSVMEGFTVNESVTLTGTIEPGGGIGEVDGVLDKAWAAADGGKGLLLLPRENSDLIRYTEGVREYHGYRVVKPEPSVTDAKAYIEDSVGIRVEYVETIGDALQYFQMARNTS
jgi:predicted S18 family serine protease